MLGVCKKLVLIPTQQLYYVEWRCCGFWAVWIEEKAKCFFFWTG